MILNWGSSPESEERRELFLAALTLSGLGNPVLNNDGDFACGLLNRF